MSSPSLERLHGMCLAAQRAGRQTAFLYVANLIDEILTNGTLDGPSLALTLRNIAATERAYDELLGPTESSGYGDGPPPELPVGARAAVGWINTHRVALAERTAAGWCCATGEDVESADSHRLLPGGRRA